MTERRESAAQDPLALTTRRWNSDLLRQQSVDLQGPYRIVDLLVVRPHSQTVAQDHPDFIFIPTGNGKFPCEFELESVSPLGHALDTTAKRLDFRFDLLADNRHLSEQSILLDWLGNL